MANETLITDLVAQEALQQLEQLDRAMEGTMEQFKGCALELAKGLKIPVEVVGDLEKLRELSNVTMQKASQATQQYTQQLQQQQQVIANTTNTISRQLMEQEKLNKVQREAYTQQQQALDVADRILGSHEQNVKALAKYNTELKALKAAYKDGAVSAGEYTSRELELKTAKQETQRILNNEQKLMQSAEGSYQQLSLQLERMKMAYKQLNEEEKAGTDGKALEKEIQQTDAHLKDLAADMGEFHRNVGNYAIANKSMRSSLRELTEGIAQLTLQYNEMSASEKQGDIGVQLREKIKQLTEQAGKYRDVIKDVKASISASASDTRWFDTMIESGKLMVSTFGLCKNAAIALGMSEDSLQQSMLKVQQAMQAVQALQVIQNTMQKQSNVMKGIGIIQSKALAAATALEAKATTQSTGATVAQTVAMKAFNAVAKANPYVLLATAILAVIGLIVGYTSATEDATEADKAAKEAADARKESMDNMAQSFGNTAGEMIAKYQIMRNEWNALGDDIKAKRQYLEQHKQDFEKLAEAVDGADAKMDNINDAEKIIRDNTGKVEEAIRRRAMAMAAYAEYIRLTQKELEELEKLSTIGEYTKYSAGDTLPAHVLRAAGISLTAGQNAISALNPMAPVELTLEQATRMTTASMKKTVSDQIEQMEEVKERYDRLREQTWDKYKEYGGLEQANFAGGGSNGSGKSGSGKSGGSANSTQVKSAEELQKILNQIMMDGYKSASLMEDKYSEEWLAKEKKRIEKQRLLDIDAAAEKREDLKKEIKESALSEKEKQDMILNAENATDDIVRGINQKAKEERMQIEEEVANHKLELLEKTAANEQIIRDKDYNDAVTKLYEEYTAELKIAQQKGEDTTKITERFNKRKEDLDNQYANATVDATINALKKELEVAGLSEEERERLQRELTEQTTQLAQQRAEQEKDAIEEVVKADEEARKKRQQNLQEWVQRAGEAVQKIGEFAGAMYDNQISKIEELLEAEQQRYDQEVQNIEYLAERGAITTEEAEIRKRDAEAATATKQEQLEKKKASLEYKKAVIEKANSIAQIGIATALGIMQTYAQLGWPAGIPGAIFIGAMGAIQAATALAQPIKAYAEGTKGKPHPGGFAIVGDAYKPEAIILDGKAYITPDNPTLVDLPRGAQVIPDVNEKDLMSMGALLPMSVPRDKATGQPIVINDYSALESRVAGNTKAVTRELRGFRVDMARQLKRQKFNAYLSKRI